MTLIEQRRPKRDPRDLARDTIHPGCRCEDKKCVCVITGGDAINVSQAEGTIWRPKLVGLVPDPLSQLPVSVSMTGVKVDLPCLEVLKCLTTTPAMHLHPETGVLRIRRSTSTPGNLLSFVEGGLHVPPIDTSDLDRGNRWFTGTADPPVAVGESRIDDLYLSSAGRVYQLQAGGWTLVMTLRMPTPSWWFGRLVAEQPLTQVASALSFQAAGSTGTWQGGSALDPFLVPTQLGWYEVTANAQVSIPTAASAGTWASLILNRHRGGGGEGAPVLDTVVSTVAPQRFAQASIRHVMVLGEGVAGLTASMASDGLTNSVLGGAGSRIMLRYLAPA